MSHWNRLAAMTMNMNTRTFGEQMVYEYVGGDAVNIRIIPYTQHDEVGLGVGVDSASHQFGIPICSLNRRPINGDLITQAGITYEVLAVLEEGIAEYRVSAHMVDARHHSLSSDHV